MTEDPEMPIRFFSRFFRTRTDTTFTINQSFFALLVIVDAFGIVIIDPNFKTWIIVYVALNLLVYPVIRKQFVTPKVANPKCNYCGGKMHTIELKCNDCGAKSEATKK